MPDQHQTPGQQLPQEFTDFPFTPLRFEDGLPVFRGTEARKELTRRFGLPNAAPRPGERLFGNCRCIFVDAHHLPEPLSQ
jgi:hypothetical protein